VIALYLLPRINLALRPRLMTELRPGARIVSHAFDMGDWRPEAEQRHDDRRIMVWIVPAVAGGAWALTDAAGESWTLALDQVFQDVTGTMAGAGGVREVRGSLRGTALRFTADGREYAGTVDDAAITGTDSAWRASRIA